MKKIILYLFILSISLNGFSQQWVEEWGIEDTLSLYDNVTGGGGIPKARDFFPDGDTLYVSGSFKFGGIDTLLDIGKWDGQSWHKMGFGINNCGGARRTLRYKGQIYTGGEFQNFYGDIPTVIPKVIIPGTERLARWNENNNTWEALPNTYGGVSSFIDDMVIYNDTLILATDAPVSAPWSGATRVTAYDADINNYVDIGMLPSTVQALEVFNGELYAGGTWFTLKKYIGGTGYGAWQDVGGDLNYYIQDMTVDTFNNFLYVAGGFYAVDDSILTDNIAIWNGYYWEKVGYGYNGIGADALSVGIYNGDVYSGLCADWGPTGGIEFNSSLLRWDGQDWHPIGPLNNAVVALGVWKNKLYIGGNFDSIAGQPIIHRGIACWLDTTPNCRYLKPRIYTDNMQDVFDIISGNVNVQFYNNNTYADTWQWDFGDTGTANIKDPNHVFTQAGTYTVSVTVTHNTCIKTFTKNITIINSQSVKEIKEETGFKIYPNPSKNLLFLEIKDEKLKIKNETVQILNINGKTVYSSSLRGLATKQSQTDSHEQSSRYDAISIDISILQNGVYFVKIGNETQRFIKK